MSKCQFCGKDAGLLRGVHKECQRVHDEGITRIFETAAQAAITQPDLPALQETVNKIASASYIDDESLRRLLALGWERAALQALDDRILSEAEDHALGAFKAYFSLDTDALNRNGVLIRVLKAAILRDILDGKIPQRVKFEGTLPFNFQKGETLVWLFQHVPYYEPRTRTTYSGSSSGVSLRIAKGVYYRVGEFRGNPVVTTQTVLVDTGIVAITDKHIYFAGDTKSFRIQYDKIVSFTRYSDGIGIQRDASTAKPQTFVTGDGWFTYNLIANLAHSPAA